MYSAVLMEHFERPRCVGPLRQFDGHARGHNAVCDDRVEIWLLLDHDRVANAAFKASGCVPVLACCSFLCAWSKEKTVSDVKGVGAEQLEEMVGGLPRHKKHASKLAVRTLRVALQNALAQKNFKMGLENN